MAPGRRVAESGRVAGGEASASGRIGPYSLVMPDEALEEFRAKLERLARTDPTIVPLLQKLDRLTSG